MRIPQQGAGERPAEEETGGQKAMRVMRSLAGVLGGAAYAAGISGAAQNPWAGPQALSQMRHQGMNNEMKRMRMAAQTEKIRRQQAIMTHMQQNFSDMSDPNQRQAAIQYLMGQGAFKFAETASTIFGQMYGTAADDFQYASETAIDPGTGGRVKVTRQESQTGVLADRPHLGAPESGQTINVGQPVGWEEKSEARQYQALVDGGMDQSLARDVINKEAFHVPMLGRYVRGKGAFREKILGLVSFQETINRIWDAATRVGKEHGETGRGTQLNAWVEKMLTGAASPAVENYLNVQQLAVAEFVKAMSGAQASDKERAFLNGLFPNIAELIDENGQISETAEAKLAEWRSRSIDYVLSNMEQGERPAAQRAYREFYENYSGSRGAEGGGAPPPAAALGGGSTGNVTFTPQAR
jgi:hypothetical protein